MENVDAATAHPKVVVRKKVRASRERVFDAWTKPELMKQWLFPGEGRAVVSNTLKTGGSYSLNMIFPKGAETCEPTKKVSDSEYHYLHTGEYLEIRRPERLVFSWTSPAVTATRVTVELRDLGDETEVIVTHELLKTESDIRSHSQGWEGALVNLANFVVQ